MEFSTKIRIAKSRFPINYDSKIMALGSCFVENMAEKLDYFKFDNAVNPFGIIFNPVSIERLVSRMAANRKFTQNDIFFHNERWHCYDVHSDLSHENKDGFLSVLNQATEQAHQQIIAATHIIITYGTSWVYTAKTSGAVVANCHKVPQNQFEKEILPIATIEKSIQDTLHSIRQVNPDCHVIFTISPVRHIKDGFVENQRSKAHLIAAIHNILDFSFAQFGSASGQLSTFDFGLLTFDYFPSYEIMMDELRDYRFYADDMLHPSQSAVNYIWEQFFLSQMDENIFEVMQEVCSIQRSLLHKPFHPDSESHRQFLEKVSQKMTSLNSRMPQIRF